MTTVSTYKKVDMTLCMHCQRELIIYGNQQCIHRLKRLKLDLPKKKLKVVEVNVLSDMKIQHFAPAPRAQEKLANHSIEQFVNDVASKYS